MNTSPRNKKRSRSPEESNNSFVKSVTSKVTGLLPATIARWFSSPSTSNTNGSAPTADGTDSSTDDEREPETAITTQPPSKRMRFSTPVSSNHYTHTETLTVTRSESMNICSPYSPAQPSPNANQFVRDTNIASTPVRSPSEEPTIDKTERVKLSKRKSLFEHSDASKSACVKTSYNTVTDPKQPCFKPSLLGSPFYPGRTVYGGAASRYMNQPNIRQRKDAHVNKSESNQNTTMSRSARRVMELLEHYSSPIMEAKRIPQYVRKPANYSISPDVSFSPNTSTGSNSSSAKRDSFISNKTQELHVPSVASILRLKQKSRLMDTTNAARQIIASHSSSVQTPLEYISVRNQRETSQSNASVTTSPTTSKSRLSMTGEGTDDGNKTPVQFSSPNTIPQTKKDNMPIFTFGIPAPKLPVSTSATISPIKNETQDKKQDPDVVSTSIKTSTPVISLGKTDSGDFNNQYTFSRPVTISSGSSPQAASTPPKFTFVSPERGIDKMQEKKNECFNFLNNQKDTEMSDKSEPIAVKCSICKVANSQTHSDKCINCERGATSNNHNNKPLLATPVKSSKWRCSDCWVENDDSSTKCVCCGQSKSTPTVNASTETKQTTSSDQNSKCSTCKVENRQLHIDKCKNCEKKPTSLNNNVNKSGKGSKWKCDGCWIENDENVEKCVCCGTTNNKKLIQNTVVKPTDNDWTCDDCWIKNKSSVDKCAACGGARKIDNNAYKNIMKTQNDKWECSNCLVKNDSDKVKCVCCETEKPGAVKEPAKKLFNFGVNTNTFKFGIDPKQQEAQIAKKLTETKPLENPPKTEESETNNNVLPKTPSFNFGIPATKPVDQTDNTDIKAKDENAKPNFTFGVPKKLLTESNLTPVFGVLKKPELKTVEDDKEKAQEVPKVEFTVPTPKPTDKPLNIGLFGAPLSSQIKEDKPSPASVTTLNPIANLNKKEPETLQPTAVTSSDIASPQNKFTISASGLKPPANLFASPTLTTSTTGIPFSSPVQTGPETSTTTLFQKSEPNTTSAVSLFQKSDQTTNSSLSLFQKPTVTSTTTSSLSQPSAAPIFSFGANPKPAAPQQTEKPKYNFSFGNSSNNISESNSFKFKFGSSADNNASPNKFSLPSGTSVGTSNPLANNPLSSGNGLPVGNPLGGNTAGTGLATGNGLTTGSLTGATELTNNALPAGNNLQTGNSLQTPAPSIFGAPKKDNIWSQPNNTTPNLFGSNNTTNSLQKPSTFTFGSSSTPFNANTPAPVFGSSAQPAQNVFGMSNPNTNTQPTLFSSPVQNQPAPSIFGGSQQASSPAPSLGMFGTPNVGAAPSFGTPNQSIPSFETPSLTPAPAPAFSFGAQPSTGLFGFGQQQQPQQQQPQAAGIYNFGANTGGTPQVQFNMGSAPSTVVRRVRKAVRRNPQR